MISTAKREDVAFRLDHIELLRAMYPSSDEMLIDPETDNILLQARQWCEDETAHQPKLPATISLCLSLGISTDSERDFRRLLLNIELPLAPVDVSTGEVPQEGRLRVNADWLTKAQATRLQDGMPEDDILSAIEHVRERAYEYITTLQQTPSAAVLATKDPEVRAWFYFPSISTREKRDDLVNHAPHYSLTGFLLAGKPGVLCLEGEPQKIDDFMKFIKTESWGNIPAGHKKVSEVLREMYVERAFPGMEEITDQLEKRGQRSNRSDMKGLEQWLDIRGLGQSFAKVLM
ncbi:related to protein C21orf6 (GL011) [Ramularia collo-cygni]|uniref:Related to protein C21orf6 (GL011) n=1 Tax=Ramularia collo-cygni TaxID=112498 RepID=A0A2D3UZ25_9PEZI|nr:related to protein C21orf6 (GL011) [Ramularia collo-cygni]CZT18460.1 related to protein C21orf6 (GL011) [Ramularia collo-cygni]